MKRIINLIFVLIFTIGIISAYTIYSGESVVLELEKPYEYYSIVGNSTEVILDIVQEGNIVTITPCKYSQEDSYEIIFFDKDTEVTVEYHSSGSSGCGGGGITTKWKTEYVDRNITEYKDGVKCEDEIDEIEFEEKNWFWKIFLGVFILLFWGMVILFFKPRKDFQEENNIDERRLNKNE